MRKLKEMVSGRVFVKMILPYAFVLIVPMIVWIVSNAYVRNNNEKNIISLVEGNIKSSVVAIDAELNRIESVVMSLSQNSAFDDFFRKNNPTYEEKIRFQKILSAYHMQDELMSVLYMYSKESEMLIDQYNIYGSPEMFYRYTCGLEGEDNELWSKRTRNIEHSDGYTLEDVLIKSGNRYTEVLPYISTIPVENATNKHGMAGVMVNKEKLLGNFESLYNDGNAEIYVYNRNGEVIMFRGEHVDEVSFDPDKVKPYSKIKLGGKNLHMFGYESPSNGWYYNVIINDSSIMKKMVVENNLLGLVNFVTFLLGLLMCIILTYGRHKSYINIMEMIGKKNNEFSVKGIRSNEFDLLRPYVGSILDESSNIKKSIEKLHSTQSHRIIHLLLTATQTSEETARKLCEESNMKLEYGKFAVVVFRCEEAYTIDSINNRNVFLRNALERYIEEEFYLYVADAKTTVALVNYDVDTAEFYIYLKKQIAVMNLGVFHRFNPGIIIGVGETTDRISRVYESYRQAMEVIEYNRLNDSKSIVFYNELPKSDTMYYFPIEFENKFIKAISCGRADEALKMTDELYENNFVKRTLSSERTKELFAELFSSIDKIRQMYFSDEERIDYQISGFTIKSFFEYLKDFVFSACENMKVFDENSINSRFKEIIEYINENYQDNNLSLSSLAQTFGFSDMSSISRSFKKYLNENFSSYLERIRIEKACKMLSAGMQVKEVSERTGYLSDVSFRRAFKKKMGISPSDYVKSRPN